MYFDLYQVIISITMDNKKVLVYGLLALLIIGISIWGLFNHRERRPPEEALLSSLIENSLNETLATLGITEKNLVKKYSEEKLGVKRGKWTQVREEFLVKQSTSLNNVYKTVSDKIKSASGEVLSHRFLDSGRKLEISLGKGTTATHFIIIIKEYFPRIAIIMDDMGCGRKIEEEILELPYPLTISVLPFQIGSQEIAELAHKSGFEVLMHQPLESKNSEFNNIEGLITKEMSTEEIKSVFMQNLKTVPYAKGVNNHAGSQGMEQEKTVSGLLDVIKKEKMFFVDSLTTPDSCAKKIATSNGVKYLERDVFIDNEKDEEYILGQIDELLSQAKTKGQAIGIAHPAPETLNAFKKALPKIEAEGIKIVPVSELLEK